MILSNRKDLFFVGSNMFNLVALRLLFIVQTSGFLATLLSAFHVNVKVLKALEPWHESCVRALSQRQDKTNFIKILHIVLV